MSDEKELPRILNVGCGTTLIPGAVNLDMNDLADVKFNLEDCDVLPLPFPDNYFESLQASHVLEHINNILPLMQELHRVAKPDAHFWVRVPYGSNSIAFEDPTHVRQFFPKSFKYFGQMAYNKADYNYRGDWEVVDMVVGIADEYEGAPQAELEQLLINAWNVGQEIFCTLQAIKPIRKPDGQPNTLQLKTAFMKQIHAQLATIMGGDQTQQH